MIAAMPASVRGRRKPWAVIAALLVACLLFTALGDWQLHRLVWKQALVARVARATTASPLAFAALWAAPPAALEYRRVVLNGRYEPASTTLVTATTDLGSGYWDMVTLRGAAAATWVNRGFVPLGSLRGRLAAGTPAGPVAVTGLIRRTEPRGTWLRANRPGADRWYSRDLAAMARARHIAAVSSQLFIDAQSETPRAATGIPVPGLTVLTFPNNHLGYAVTWFALALVSLGGVVVVWRRPS